MKHNRPAPRGEGHPEMHDATARFAVTVQARFWKTVRHWPKQHPYLIRRIRVQLRQLMPSEPFVVVQDADDIMHHVIMEVEVQRADVFVAELRAHADVLTVDPLDVDENEWK
ncbi:MAG: hypothetical protein M3R24_05710 [Chloroflexota bacterium]|nr:hypothetical protein [Chloroflexota bacterium]